MSDQQNEVVNLLRGFAKKLASAPDRMTTSDGQGGITTSKEQPKKDPGEGDLKQDLPTDGTIRTSDGVGVGPDRMTTADGQGGITTHAGTPKKDSGEGDLKQDLPTDGTTRKSARVEAIRSAIFGKNPALAPAPAAGNQPPATQKQAQAAGADAPIDISKDMLAKIASDILATEEGINFVYSLREKAAGARAAREELTSALHAAEYFDEVEQVKSAAMNDVFTKAASIHNELSQILTEQDADEILKTAAIHQAALLECGDDLLKMAYAAGMDDAALMEAGAEAGEGGEEGMPPEGGEGGELPMSGEEGLGEEEVLQLLQQLIESGEITEEEIMQALQESGAGAEGGEMPPEAGGMPPM